MQARAIYANCDVRSPLHASRCVYYYHYITDMWAKIKRLDKPSDRALGSSRPPIEKFLKEKMMAKSYFDGGRAGNREGEEGRKK